MENKMPRKTLEDLAIAIVSCRSHAGAIELIRDTLKIALAELVEGCEELDTMEPGELGESYEDDSLFLTDKVQSLIDSVQLGGRWSK